VVTTARSLAAALETADKAKHACRVTATGQLLGVRPVADHVVIEIELPADAPVEIAKETP